MQTDWAMLSLNMACESCTGAHHEYMKPDITHALTNSATLDSSRPQCLPEHDRDLSRPRLRRAQAIVACSEGWEDTSM